MQPYFMILRKCLVPECFKFSCPKFWGQKSNEITHLVYNYSVTVCCATLSLFKLISTPYF